MRKWVEESTTFWTDELGFYFDGVSFAHKFHPYGEATYGFAKARRRVDNYNKRQERR